MKNNDLRIETIIETALKINNPNVLHDFLSAFSRPELVLVYDSIVNCLAGEGGR